MDSAGILTNRMPVLRAERRWSQQELADRVGVSRQTIVSLEANRYNPSLKLAFQIARAFELPLEEVFHFTLEEDGTA